VTFFLNGQFVSEREAVVSVLDRGFLYGDGLFETLRVIGGRPFRWAQHWSRLQAGAVFLKIALPFSSPVLLEAAGKLVRENQLPDAILRLTISRGIGPRGYSPRGAGSPTVAMTLHAAAERATQTVARWRLVTSSFRLPANEPLAQFKTCNKLPQILARAEADAAGADEALLCNTDGHVVEGSSSNLFWIQDNQVCTPPLAGGILPGVTRAAVIEVCETLNIAVRETNISAKDLHEAQGVFVSLSTAGIAEAASLDGQQLHQSPLVPSLQSAYLRLLVSESQTNPT
jgi:aminodeoxychorismate lyase